MCLKYKRYIRFNYEKLPQLLSLLPQWEHSQVLGKLSRNTLSIISKCGLFFFNISASLLSTLVGMVFSFHF